MTRAQSDPERVKAVIDAVNAITEFESRFFQHAVSREPDGVLAEGWHRDAIARMERRQALSRVIALPHF